jgi:adenylate kinase
MPKLDKILLTGLPGCGKTTVKGDGGTSVKLTVGSACNGAATFRPSRHPAARYTS